MTTREKVIALKGDMTIKELSESAKISRDTIAKWDKVSPTMGTLKKVADVLGVKVADLIGD